MMNPVHVSGPLKSTVVMFLAAMAAIDASLTRLVSAGSKLVPTKADDEGREAHISLLACIPFGITCESVAPQAQFALAASETLYKEHDASVIFRFRCPKGDVFLLVQCRKDPTKARVIVPRHRTSCPFGQLVRDMQAASCS